MTLISLLLYLIGAANNYMTISALSKRGNGWIVKRSLLWPYHAVKDIYDAFKTKS